MKRNIKTSISVMFLSLLMALFILPIVRAEGAPLQESLAPDEMGVYFIRDSHFYGAARHVWLACNDKVLASIGSGNYVFFKAKNGPNVINVVQAKTPAGFYLLKYRPGATVYLKYEYTQGTITEVPEYVGEQALKENKSVPILEKTESNDAYEVSLMNPGLLGIELMKTVENELKPDSENATITFIRPENFIKDVPFGIWGEEGYLGTLRGKTYFRVSVKPGKHLFIAKSEKYAVVEANVEAGREYYIQFKAKVGMFLAGVQMMPITKATKDTELQEWLKSSTEITFDQELLTDDIKSLMEKTKPILEDVLKKVEKGEIKAGKLSAEDAR